MYAQEVNSVRSEMIFDSDGISKYLSEDEMIFIGNVVLENKELVRRLVALGWDTLEVHDNQGCFGCKWELINYAKIDLMLE